MQAFPGGFNILAQSNKYELFHRCPHNAIAAIASLS
jgi:hypothetical protein